MIIFLKGLEHWRWVGSRWNLRVRIDSIGTDVLLPLLSNDYLIQVILVVFSDFDMEYEIDSINSCKVDIKSINIYIVLVT